MDIYAALQNDHNEVKEILKKLQASPDNDDLLDQLKKELLIHNKAEEETFYSPLKQKLHSLDVVLDFSEKEHKVIDEMINKFEEVRKNIGDNDRRLLLQLIEKSILAHVDKEENEIFELAKNCFSSTEAQDINNIFKDKRDKLRAGYKKEGWKDTLENTLDKVKDMILK